MGGMTPSAVAPLFVKHEWYVATMRAPEKIATLVPQTFGLCFGRWLVELGLSGEESARELLCNYGYRISYWRKLHMEYGKKLTNPVYRLF